MKKLLAASLSALMLVSFAGCTGGNTGSTPNSGSSGDTAPVSGPTTVRMAISSEPDNLDPMISAATDTQSTLLLNIFEGLLSFNEKGEFISALATEYSISEDGLEYSFKLKENVKFHNGQSFTSKDVKYTYDSLAGLAGSAPLNETMASLVESVETDGDFAVTIKLKAKNAGFITKCIIPISPEGYADAATKPIGTGPYKFVEYLPGQKVTLTKYEDYSTSDLRKPVVDNVEISIMTDENARLMALKSGGLDISFISAKDIPALESAFQIIETPSNSVQVMGLNNTVAPLNDVRVRQAINYAINKEEIIVGAFSGKGTRVDSFLSPVMAKYYNSDMTVYNTDIEKAKSLLAEAGLSDGFTLKITVPSNYQVHVDTAQIVKNQLAKVNINVEIELVEWAAWLENVYTNAQYEATIIGHTGKLDPNDFLNRFDSSYARNYFKYSNPEYDALIAEAATLTDDDARAKVFKECQQILVDDAAAVFIHDNSSVYAIANGLSGFKTYPIPFYDFASLRFE